MALCNRTSRDVRKEFINIVEEVWSVFWVIEESDFHQRSINDFRSYYRKIASKELIEGNVIFL